MRTRRGGNCARGDAAVSVAGANGLSNVGSGRSNVRGTEIGNREAVAPQQTEQELLRPRPWANGYAQVPLVGVPQPTEAKGIISGDESPVRGRQSRSTRHHRG